MKQKRQTSTRWLNRILVPSIPGGFLVDALTAYEILGYDIDRLMVAEDLTKHKLLVPGFRVSINDYATLLARACQEMQDSALGFLDNKIPLQAFSVFAVGLASCRNIQEVVSHFNKFVRLFSSQLSITFQAQCDSCSIVVTCTSTQNIDCRSLYHAVMLHCYRLLNWLVGETINPKYVCFTAAQRNHEVHLEYLFGSEVLFSQTENKIVLPSIISSLTLSCNIDQIAIMLEELSKTVYVADNRDPFSRQVRKNILFYKQDYWPNIADVGKKMNLSSHQLWRKLKHERTTFSQVRDDVKRDWALALVQNQSLNIEQISQQLHFSDASAFHKAFKKWTSMRVTDYRIRLQS